MDPLVSLVFTIFFKLFEHPKPGGEISGCHGHVTVLGEKAKDKERKPHQSMGEQVAERSESRMEY